MAEVETDSVKTCFVMQPFDKGVYERRFVDIFEPAIRDAGLKPYRIDRDPAADLLVEDIERGILSAEACFAEITTDNPNVWYELGFAMAAKKPVCMICSSERPTDFPFDVRHRKIITYETGSTSDFAKLQASVTERLKALLNKQEKLEGLAAINSSVQTAGLTSHEVALLTVIASNFDSVGVSQYTIKTDMNKAGYTSLAAGIALASLAERGMIEYHIEQDVNYNESWKAWNLTASGNTWLYENQSLLQLRKSPGQSPLSSPRQNSDDEVFKDDDIPF